MTSISVIIPIYNKSEYLATCLDSVLKQTLEDMEIICINDGSTDDSLEIIEKYQKENNNIIVIDKANTGVSDSRNIGIERSGGKYLCFMDPDDFYPDARILEELFTLAEENHVAVCGGSFSSIKDGEIIKKYSGLNKKYVFDKNGMMNYSDYQFDYGFHRFIYDTDMIIKNGIRFPNYIRFQDPPFFVKCMSVAGCFYATTKVTYCYREAYKSVEWNLSKKIDMLKGIQECIVLSKEYDLMELQKLTCSRLVSEYYKSILFRNDSKYECSLLISILENIKDKISETNRDYVKEIGNMIETMRQNVPDYAFKPKISVIIPVYNVSKYIKDCLDSVLNQSFQDFQIVCVDDGSEDDSGVICDEYAKKDQRIKVIHKYNGGLSSARNSGADYATGDFLYFLDSDDMIMNNALEEICSTMVSNSLDVLFFDATTIYESKRLENSKNNFKNMYSNRMDTTPVCTGMELLNRFIINDAYRTPVQLSAISREFYEQKNICCYPGILHEDNLYSFHILTMANRSMYVNKELYIRRIRDDSIMTSKKRFEHFYGYFRCYAEMYKTLDEDTDLKNRNLIKELIRRTKISAKTVFENLSPSESSRVNEMSAIDKNFIALHPPFLDKPSWFDSDWNIPVIVTKVDKSVHDISEVVSKQSAWGMKFYLLAPHYQREIVGAKSYNDVVSCMEEIKGEYAIICDSNTQFDGHLISHAFKQIGNEVYQFQTFYSDCDNQRRNVTISSINCVRSAMSNHLNEKAQKMETDLIYSYKKEKINDEFTEALFPKITSFVKNIKNWFFTIINK